MQSFDSKKVERIIGYTFKDKKLLKSAFIHSSYANEHKDKSNERLEYLGDSVLSFIVSDFIFKNYKNNEGDLSKIRASLVSEKSLSFIFNELNLAGFILKGEGLKNQHPTPAMMADAFEALVASIYIDGGIDQARIFVLNLFESAFLSIMKEGVPESNKSLLQERFKTAKIYYETKHQGEGPEKTYTAKVYINGVVCGEGKSGKKRDAEELSAKQALNNIKKK